MNNGNHSFHISRKMDFVFNAVEVKDEKSCHNNSEKQNIVNISFLSFHIKICLYF